MRRIRSRRGVYPSFVSSNFHQVKSSPNADKLIIRRFITISGLLPHQLWHRYLGLRVHAVLAPKNLFLWKQLVYPVVNSVTFRAPQKHGDKARLAGNIQILARGATQ